MKHSRWQILISAAFLMATSAIGPGFLTQTAVFTQQLSASFAFVILVSCLIDIAVQLNVWRVIAVAEKRAQDIANTLLPGLGYFVAFLIVIGGLIFNVGNVGGAGLGANVVFSTSPLSGAIISAVIAIAIFLAKEATKIMDRLIIILGSLMIGLILYVAISSAPPVLEAAKQSIFPEKIDFMAIVTLVGGTVGGYITYAGGHRLLEAGIKGKQALPQVNKSAISAIGIASLIRVLFFLAALGVISSSLTLNANNPAASIFQLSLGSLGYKFFGIVMWCAAITSIIGASYTVVSFIQTFHPWLDKYHRQIAVIFIIISTLIFSIIGQPVTILVYAGAINGLILPITLGVILIAANNRNIVADYQHPKWLTTVGILVLCIMAYMSIHTIFFLL